MSSLELTRDWLKTVLRPYPSRDRILPEVMEVLGHRRSLNVKTDAFTFDTGQTALLLLLYGTIPISYRGATYQIPVHIWLPQEYPRAPPMAYVVPTKDMGVRKSREVDPGGRVREEVVEEWWRGWEAKTLEVLIGHLIALFSAAPPVYARPPEAAAARSPPPSTSPARPSSFVDSPAAGPSYSQVQPPPPPPARPGALPALVQEALPQYRPAPTPPPHPVALQSPTRQASGSFSPQPRSPQSPPIPNRPYHREGSLPLDPGPAIPTRPYVPNGFPHAASASPASPLRSSMDQYPPPLQSGQVPNPAYVNQVASQQPPVNPALYNQHYAPTASHPQVVGPHYHQPPPPPSVPVQSPLAPPITQPPLPAMIRRPMTDLLSSPEASTSTLPQDAPDANTAPPPLPPSKPPPPSLLHLHSILLPHLTAALPPLLQSLQTNRAHLVERKEDLVSGEPAIRDEMARLEAVKKVCDSTGRKMADVVGRAEERVAELENRGEVSVDELVCGISIVHNQLIDLVAEDNAIEDTIYHMTRALDSERVDLDRFLKSIRTLAREQYMKRALIERILEGMGQTQGW